MGVVKQVPIVLSVLLILATIGVGVGFVAAATWILNRPGFYESQARSNRILRKIGGRPPDSEEASIEASRTMIRVVKVATALYAALVIAIILAHAQ